jgi:hypothetical protein
VLNRRDVLDEPPIAMRLIRYLYAEECSVEMLFALDAPSLKHTTC